jgi:hypothetical protein
LTKNLASVLLTNIVVVNKRYPKLSFKQHDASRNFSAPLLKPNMPESSPVYKVRTFDHILFDGVATK